MDDTDIVTRLRGHIAITTRIHYAKDGYPEPVYVHGPSPICQEAADEIERLRAERNEARIKLCRLDAESRSQNARISGFSDHYYSPKQIANERGWDCFKASGDDSHPVQGGHRWKMSLTSWRGCADM